MHGVVHTTEKDAEYMYRQGTTDLARNRVVVSLTVQEGHDNAKASMEAGQGIPQGDVGADRGAVSKTIQMPATLHTTPQRLTNCRRIAPRADNTPYFCVLLLPKPRIG